MFMLLKNTTVYRKKEKKPRLLFECKIPIQVNISML